MTTRNREQGNNVRTVQSAAYKVTEGIFDNKYENSVGLLQNGVLDHLTYDGESMTDVADNPGGFNICVHEKLMAGGKSAKAHIVYHDSSRSPRGKMTIDIDDGAGSALLQYSNHLVVPDGAALAIARVPTLVPEQLSVLNSLFELKDCKRALSRVSEHIAWARLRAVSRKTKKTPNSVASQFTGPKESVPTFIGDLLQIPKTPAAWVTRLTGHDLAWKFGWKPLIADIQKVHSVLGSLDKKLAELTEKEFSCIGHHRETATDNPVSYDKYKHSYCPYLWFTHKLQRTTKVHWTAGVKRKLSPLALARPDLTKLAIARESLGLSLNSEVVWEAVPFSFVADWFLPINNFLEQFNGSAIDPELVVDGVKWNTIKSETTTTCTIKLEPFDQAYKPYYILNTEETKIKPGLVDIVKTSYFRNAGSWTPPGLYIPQLKLPNLGQAWTGIELLAQKFRTIAR